MLPIERFKEDMTEMEMEDDMLIALFFTLSKAHIIGKIHLCLMFSVRFETYPKPFP